MDGKQQEIVIAMDAGASEPVLVLGVRCRQDLIVVVARIVDRRVLGDDASEALQVCTNAAKVVELGRVIRERSAEDGGDAVVANRLTVTGAAAYAVTVHMGARIGGRIAGQQRGAPPAVAACAAPWLAH